MVIQERPGARERVLPTTPLHERSLGELFATFSRDLALLVHQEIELAKTDLKISMAKVAAGAGGLAVAVVALLMAAPIISIAAALGIHALGVTLGWSFLIIGGVWIGLALAGAAAGGLALRRLRVQKRTVDSLKADLQAFARKSKP